MAEQLAQWMQQNVTCVDYGDDDSTLLVFSRLTNYELWQLRGESYSADILRMYEETANTYPMYSHWWVGKPQGPRFWLDNAKKS